jgi:hypothetical protein
MKNEKIARFSSLKKHYTLAPFLKDYLYENKLFNIGIIRAAIGQL